MKKIIFIIGLTLVVVKSDAQETFSRNSFWTETVVNGVIDGKWRYQFDFQYRRSSDASDVSGGSNNIFKNSAQHVYRPWIHYQLNENVRFSLSPLGLWETFTPASEAGGVNKIQPEFRICPQITLTNKIGRVVVDQRYRFEHRLFGSKVDDLSISEFGYGQGMDFPADNAKNRFRYFVRVMIPLGHHQKIEEKTFYINAWNEIFLGLGDHTNNDKIWDQNRTFCLLGYKPKMGFPMRFEMGYGLQFANRFVSTVNSAGILTETGHKKELNNVLQVFVIFENFNLLFKKKK